MFIWNIKVFCITMPSASSRARSRARIDCARIPPYNILLNEVHVCVIMRKSTLPFIPENDYSDLIIIVRWNEGPVGIITQPYSEVYWAYFRSLVFGNSLTKHNKLTSFSYSVVILSSRFPTYRFVVMHANPPDFPRLFEPRVIGSVISGIYEC